MEQAKNTQAPQIRPMFISFFSFHFAGKCAYARFQITLGFAVAFLGRTVRAITLNTVARFQFKQYLTFEVCCMSSRSILNMPVNWICFP